MRGGYHTALSYEVIHHVHVSVSFRPTFAKIEVIWFHTSVSDQNLACLLHVMHIN